MEATQGMKNIGLKSWPFSGAPDLESACNPWADRENLKYEVNRMFRRLLNDNDSTLHLVWAGFGEGKTHTLQYLRELALAEPDGKVFPIYSVLPVTPRNFMDVYREIIKGIGFDRVIDSYMTARGNTDTRQRLQVIFNKSAPSLPLVLDQLAMGSDDMKQIACRWLQADRNLQMSEVRSASIPGKIKDNNDAVAVISALIKLFLACGYSRILLMIDEYQRTRQIRGGNIDDINFGLHTLYNECSRGLSLVLSFSFGNPEAITAHLSGELRDRADWDHMIHMPPMSRNDAEIFLRDLLDGARDPHQEQKIDDDIIPVIVHCAENGKSMKPRRLNQIMKFVLGEGSLDIEDGCINIIDAAYAENLFNKKGAPKEEEEEV